MSSGVSHSGKRPFQCDDCDKAFKHSSSLVIHKMTHSGEKPFQCDECDKAFKLSFSLVQHRRIHSGERPFQCDECDKTFRLSSFLALGYTVGKDPSSVRNVTRHSVSLQI